MVARRNDVLQFLARVREQVKTFRARQLAVTQVVLDLMVSIKGVLS